MTQNNLTIKVYSYLDKPKLAMQYQCCIAREMYCSFFIYLILICRYHCQITHYNDGVTIFCITLIDLSRIVVLSMDTLIVYDLASL